MYKLKKSSPLTGILAALLALAVIRFLFVVLTISSREIPVGMTVILLVVYGIAAVVFLILLLRIRRSHLIFSENGIVYTPPFGDVKNLAYSDLQKLSMGGRSYILYTLDGKKLVTFDDFRIEHGQCQRNRCFPEIQGHQSRNLTVPIDPNMTDAAYGPGHPNKKTAFSAGINRNFSGTLPSSPRCGRRHRRMTAGRL